MEVAKEFSQKAKEDFKLIEKALKEKDEKAYESLMKRYQKSVYFMLLKMVNNPDDAEDLTIEAFAKAFRNLARFNPEFAFSTWLFKIATNNCIDFIRRRKMRTLSIDNPYHDEDGDIIPMDIRDSGLNPQEVTIKNQKAEIMQNLVKDLPPKYKRLVELRYFNEYSYEEIADILKAPLGTVKAQLHRARELLGNMLPYDRENI
ncbi:MAG: RNA polymerase subunit sigma-24 [Bacteroidetes bacterium RIFCSPLOWO2_02_FULL_36_8]|nr:MAG: RNA polymerase subunit sigma-24 [Bacteroidetes bacterium RIFCSPLOWO2_02_FULL_36_8]OFY72099.1 MAG: RNA polymerase subunit sigma-24 [Bacteroidetes bacterium RIFCSPLOWO2_12_FULL_37_12]